MIGTKTGTDLGYLVIFIWKEITGSIGPGTKGVFTRVCFQVCLRISSILLWLILLSNQSINSYHLLPPGMCQALG